MSKTPKTLENIPVAPIEAQKALRIEYLDKVYHLYLKWYVQPVDERSPTIQDGFEEEFGVTSSDIEDFHKKDSFADDIIAITIKWAKGKVPTLLKGVYNELVANPKMSNVEKFIKSISELEGKSSGTTNNIVNVFKIDPNKKKIIMERALKKSKVIDVTNN